VHSLTCAYKSYIQNLAEATNDEDEWELGGNGEDIM